MRRFSGFLLFIPLFITSCIHSKKATRQKVAKEYVTLDTVKVTAAKNGPNTMGIYRASAPVIWDITHTRVALSFNWRERTTEGRAWIDIHPYAFPQDTLSLDAKSMRIDTVLLMSGHSSRPLAFTYKDEHLKIDFSQSIAPSDTVQLYIRYKALPYAAPTGGSSAISDDRGLYFINTDYSIPNKPAQIWTQGETESNSHWLPTIDKPNERFTVQVELAVADSMQTLGNGYLKQVPGKNGMRTDIWTIDKPIQTYAIMFAIGRFSIVKEQWKGKEVNYYVEPEFAPYAAKMFNNTPEMIDYFSTITGVQYPWNKYDQVVVRDYVSGAMENTTASLFGEFMNQNNREVADKNFEDVVSHELFHQWFGDYVTAESWSNLTVNESFANYGEQLWREHKYGKASVDKLAYEDIQKYLYNTQATDPALVRFYYNDKEDMFDRISYEKGGAVLNYIHGLAGDAAFYKAMNIYLTKNALHSAEASQWRLAVEEATGKDWNWFFNQWYYHGGHPVVEVKYNYDDAAGQLTVNVTQKESDSSYLYQLPLKAALIYGNDRTLVDWNITNKKESFKYPYKNGQRPIVTPDATHWLVGELKDNKASDARLVEFRASNDYITKRLAVASAFRKINDSSAQVIFDLGLTDKIPSIRAFTLDEIAKLSQDKWQQRWKTQVAGIAVTDGDHEVRASAFDVLGEWKVTASKNDMIAALSDSSYTVAGSALDAISKIDSEKAYSLAKNILPDNPRGELQSVAWKIIARRGNAGDIVYFEQRAPYVYGAKKLSLDGSLLTYLEKVNDDAAFERGLKVMVALANNESIKSYRQYAGYMMFQLGKHYKGDSAEDKRRLALTKQYVQQVVNAEKEEENLKQYKELMTSTFGAEKKDENKK